MSAPRLSEAVDPDSARAAARSILGRRQFRTSHTPRPLRKPLNWLGDRLTGIGHWIGHVLSHVPTVLLLLIAIVAIGLAIAFVTSKVRANRSVTARSHGFEINGAPIEDPADLERAADAAEHAGQLDVAVRLRFRAGLLRLGDRGAIRYRPSVTTNEVRRVLGSDAFDELARTFEAIAYGGRDAEPPDVDAARREWPRIVAGAAKGGSDAG